MELSTQQILLPKKVYIGDSAELRCTFNSNSLYLKNYVNGGAVQLSASGFCSPLNQEDYSVQNITLSSAGVDYYQLSVNFVSWKTGTLYLPDYNISENFDSSDSLNLNENIKIHFEPVNIVSITEQNSITGLSPSAPPMLLPGTTYQLYAGILLFILFLIIFIRSITKRNEIAFYIRNKKLLWKYRKNKRRTIKQLKTLLVTKKGAQITDNTARLHNFCGKVQNILRNYLEVRFNQPFTKTVTSDFMKTFQRAFGGTDDFSSLMSEKKENACIQMTGIFTRTDYLRYSTAAVQEVSENDVPEEMAGIVTEAIECIETLEGDDKSKSETGGNNV